MLRKITGFIILLLLAATALSASESRRVNVVSLGDGSTLWLPASVSPVEIRAASELYLKYESTWKRWFGVKPALPDPIVVEKVEDVRQDLFGVLWRNSSVNLSPYDRSAARQALTYFVMDNPSPFEAALSGVADSGRIGPRELDSVLAYLFLNGAVGESSVLPGMLPPGKNGERLVAKVAEAGVSREALMNRFAAWIFQKAIEGGFISGAPGTLPAAWALDHDLRPGGFNCWSFDPSAAVEGIEVQSALPAPAEFRLFSLFTDERGHVLRAGVGSLSTKPVSIPKGGGTMWLILWNGGREVSGSGLTLTLWKDFTPPFTIKEVSMNGRNCDLLLEEEAGISAYRVSQSSKRHDGDTGCIPPFPSLGEGLHSYRLRLQPSYSALDLNLSCTTSSGGLYTVPLDSGKESGK